MTADTERRLHGIAVYNPDLLSKQELVAQFVARRELFAELVADLRRPKFTQHQLIVGHRGMGKTTLLRRLRYAVEDDPELSSRWIALAFPEEQYNVSRLSDLYLNCIDALGDALERTGRQSEADALDKAREKLPNTDEPRRTAAALDLLLGTARKLKRRLLLLVDNLDLILDRLDVDQWTIRELLSREDRLLLIGATPFVIGATYSYEAPFYDFFRVHELHGLSFEETSEILSTLAREMNAPEVERLVRDEPARIRTLHVLAGGNPRTIVLLFSVLAQGTEGDVRSDLEKLLDQTTPLYKARFESLAPQSQQVVDALAIHWDPISAAELAEKLRLDVNIVSSQLNRLAQQGVVEKVPYDPTTKIGFQIAERFFNIWYLMRASRRVRRRLTWLVQFLRLFYGLDQLQLQARDLLRSQSDTMPLRQAEFCLAIAEALEQDRPTRLALESRAIQAMLATDELRREMQTLFDLDGADAGLKPVIDRQTWAREYQEAIDAAPNIETADLLRLLGSTPDVGLKEKLTVARGLATMSDERQQKLRSAVASARANLQRALGTRLVEQLGAAILTGYVVSVADEETVSSAAAALNLPALELLPRIGVLRKAKLLEIARATDEPLAWAQYAFLLGVEGRATESEEALRRANLGELGTIARIRIARAEHVLGRHETAVAMLQDFLPEDPTPPEFWFLAKTYRAINEPRLGQQVLQRGLTLYPDEPQLLREYGISLRRNNLHREAKQILEKAVTIDPRDESAWISLAATSRELDEDAGLKVIERGLEWHRSTYLSAMHFYTLLSLDRHGDALRALGGLSLEKSSPKETLTVARIAQMLASALPWENVAPLLRMLLPRAVHQWNEPEMTETSIELFSALARQGQSARATELLDELNLQEPLRPVCEALRIHAAGNRDALNRLAPELRDPVIQLLDAWQETPAAATREPKKKRKAASAVKRSRRLR